MIDHDKFCFHKLYKNNNIGKCYYLFNYFRIHILPIILATLKGFSIEFNIRQFLLSITCSPHDYFPIANHLGLASIAEHRCSIAENCFGLLTGDVDSPILFYLLRFKVSQVLLILLQCFISHRIPPITWGTNQFDVWCKMPIWVTLSLIFKCSLFLVLVNCTH